MKKILTGIFAIVLLMGINVHNPMRAFGASQYEYEDNNSYETANIINLGDSISGNLSEGKDVDYYMFTPDVDGLIELDFCHIFKEIDSIWGVNVYVNDNGQYSNLSEYRIGLKSKETISLPSIGAVKGRTYYVVVYDYYTNGIIGEDYTIRTSFTESNNCEKELNNEFSTATPIELNQNYGGTLGKGNDKDYFKIVAPADGKIALDFCHTFKEINSTWGVDVYVNDNGQYSNLSEYRIGLKSKETISLPSIGAVKGKTYYVVVYDYYESGIIGEDYAIRTSFTESNNYEKELNNEFSTATPIELNQNYGGTLGKGNDKDYFKIEAPADGKIALDFCHTYKEVNSIWGVSIYVNDNGQYSNLGEYPIGLNYKETISLPDIGAAKGKTYYVMVYRYYENGIIGEDYTIKTKLYLNSPSYLRIKINNKTANLQWGKVNDIDGYEIFYKESGSNGKYKKLNITTKNSYSYKNLAKGKTYHFRVRAYKTIENKKYYSKFISSKKVKRK